MPHSIVIPHDDLYQDIYTIGVFLSIPIVEQYVAEFQKNPRYKILTSAANFGDALKQAEEWEAQGVDVFVSRRGTGELLRQNFSTPVLTLPMSELEIIHCLRSSCPRGSLVLVPIFGETYAGLSQLEELIGVRIVQHVYTNFTELETLVQRGIHWNVDFVAGGGSTQRLAQKYGISFVSLAPSREQFLSILDSAANVASFYREKESMINEMQGMMDSMMDGFLSVDAQGTILACNTVARDLLGAQKREEIIGASIFTYMTESIFHEILHAEHGHDEKVISMNATPMVVHSTVVKRRNSVEKALFSLRKVQDVIRQSGSIRSAISGGFETHYRLSDMVYKSTAIHDIINLCRIYAKTNSSVLIGGETGTGKEIISQGIHNSSKRKKKPFVSINCAELPEHLLESELFGYDEGAFTGSRKGGKAGFFELAHGGTLLLDEIDSASTLVQSKLLRVLQEKEIMRIGGKRKIPIDVRVLATSGRDLWEAVCQGSFRKDLFFRLNVMSVHIPPLRDRLEDVEALLPHFLLYFAQRENTQKPTLRREHIQLLKKYPWPGNIRQLRHFAERFVLYSSFMEDPFSHLYHELHRITMHNAGSASWNGLTEHSPTAPTNLAHGASSAPAFGVLPPLDINGNAAHMPGGGAMPTSTSLTPPLPPMHAELAFRRPREHDEAALIQEALKNARYSKTEAAHLLGMSRSTLWRKLKQYNIE